MTELWVKDKFGKPRDIILGYDDNVRFWLEGLKVFTHGHV